MSDQEEEVEDEENEDEDEENQDDENEDEDQEGDDQDEDEDEDGDQDQDQDQDQDNQGEEDQEGDDDEEKNSEEERKKAPTFKPVSQEFGFKNLLADIVSLSHSVDNFITTLPSRGGTGYRSYQPRISYDPKPATTQSFPIMEQRKYTIMKDEDVQVSMQPQIVIQQTIAPKQQIKKEPYKISNQSTKFLAQLYEENKKLKRWKNNQTGNSMTGGWYNSKEKFERGDHQRGLINLDDRNKEIDQAIQMLRREDNQ